MRSDSFAVCMSNMSAVPKLNAANSHLVSEPVNAWCDCVAHVLRGPREKALCAMQSSPSDAEKELQSDFGP